MAVDQRPVDRPSAWGGLGWSVDRWFREMDRRDEIAVLADETDYARPRFSRSVAGLSALYPWMAPGAIISAASVGLDETMPEARRLAALDVVDQLASPLGLRDVASGVPRSYNPDAETFANAVRDAWWEVRDRAESSNLGLSNRELWEAAVEQARGTMETVAMAAVQQQRTGRPTDLSPAARTHLSQPQQSAVSDYMANETTFTPPAAGAPAAVQDTYAAQQSAYEVLRGPGPQGPMTPNQSRRLVENAIGMLAGRTPVTAADQARFGPTVQESVDQLVTSGEQTAAWAQSPVNRVQRQSQQTLEDLRARYGTDAPDDSWSEEDAGRFEFAQTSAEAEGAANMVEMSTMSTFNPMSPVIRGATIGLNAPLQELQGIFRGFVGMATGENFDFESQSDLGVIAGQWLSGEGDEVDTGSGYFMDPDSAVAQERYRREITRGDVGGHVITIGRSLASTVFEPDTTPFDILSGSIDAFVAVRGDPVNPLMDLASTSVAARAGIIGGTRRMLAPDVVDAWLRSDEGIDVARAFSEVDPTDATAVYRVWRQSNRRIPYPVLRRLVSGSSGDVGYVTDLLRGHLGLDMRRFPKAPDLGGWRPKPTVSRLAGMMPSSSIQITDPNSAVLTVERYYRNLGAPEELIARRVGEAADMFAPHQIEVVIPGMEGRVDEIRQMLEGIAGEAPLPASLQGMGEQELAMLADDLEIALDDALSPGYRDSLMMAPDREGWYNFATKMLAEDTVGILQDNGVPDNLAGKLSQLWIQKHTSQFVGWQDDLGDGRRIVGAVVDGKPVAVASPHLVVEHLDSNIPLPNAQALRRATSLKGIRAMTMAADGDVRFPIAGLEFLQDTLWKPSVLLRFAWPIRVIGEEQLRMAAAGLESTFRHPISYISWVTGKRGGIEGLGNAFQESEQWARSQATGTAGWTNSQRWRRSGEFKVYTRSERNGIEVFDEEFERAWGEQIAMFYADPVIRPLSRVGTANSPYATPQELVEAIARGRVKTSDGQPIREWLEQTHPEWLARRFPTDPTYAERLADGDAVIRSLDDWVESMSIRLDELTGGSDEILDAIRTGTMEVPTKVPGQRGPGTVTVPIDARGTNRLDRAFLRHLRTLAPEHAPAAVPGATMEVTNKGIVNGVVESMFSFLMAKPTNYLSRSPAFRQFYWTQMEDLISHGTPAAQRQILRSAGGRGPRPARALSRWLDTAEEAKTAAQRREAFAQVTTLVDDAADDLDPVTLGVIRRALTRAEASQSLGATEIETIRTAIARTSGANLRRGALRNLERGTGAQGMLSAEELDWLAKGHALDDTRQLLYDLTEKSQFFDATRLVFPFGEAWKEVLTRWAGMVSPIGPGGWQADFTARPLRRLSQGVEEARENDFLPSPPGEEGFFWENAWGEEVFVYPGSEWFTDRFIGIPIPLTGRVQGLSLATEIYPGFGPLIQIPAQWLLSAKPSWTGGVPLGDTRPFEAAGVSSTLRELILPFGEDASWWDSLAPPAWRSGQLALAGIDEDNPWLGWLGNAARWFESSEGSDRAFGSAVAEMARVLSSSGDYEVNDPEDQERLWADANSMAPAWFFVKGLGQATLPSSPQPEFMVQDSNGATVRAAYLTDEWQAIQEEFEGDYWAGVQAFMDRHGENNHLFMQAKTVEITMNVPLDNTGFRWMNAHSDVVSDYPNSFGFYAPEPEDPNDFSSEAFRSAIERGYREGLTAEGEQNEMRRLDQHRMATLRYRQAEEYELQQAAGVDGDPAEATLDEEAMARLDAYRDQLRNEFPGYQDFGGMTQRVTNEFRETRIVGTPAAPGELRRAMEDERINPTIRAGIREFIEAWDYALADAESRGLRTLNNQEMTPVRQWFRYTLAPDIIERHPGIAGVWTFIFDPLLDETA